MIGRAILTAAEMRAAEDEAITRGTSAWTLMERAGMAAADAIWRYSGPRPTLVLCGPGNNGGDGYVIAAELARRGASVRVSATGEPRTETARRAAKGWTGPVAPLAAAEPAPMLVDALFGTGLTRALEADVSERLRKLSAKAAISVAIDLPSGVATDDGAILSPVPDYELTITFGALKRAHLLQPAARHMGRLLLADIGIEARSKVVEIARPTLPLPGPDSHKYNRGYVGILAGAMPGAAALSAAAAARSGAGYVRLAASERIHNVPSSVVQGSGGDLLADSRVGTLIIGPGLGRGSKAADMLDQALASDFPLVIDADALVLLSENSARLRQCATTPILTPHEGEFRTLFAGEGDKLERAQRAAKQVEAVIVYKGADTVVAAPDGRCAIAPPASAWLASAGTGDVLSGIIAAMRAIGLEAFEAACAGVWIHSRAAEIAGPGLIADDLIAALPLAIWR